MEDNVHCPNCGTKALSGQKFCRACGLSLDRFARLLIETPSDIEDSDVEQARRRMRQLESGAKLTGWVVGLVAWLLIAGVIAGMGINAIINLGDIAGGVMMLALAVVSIVAAGLLIYYASLHAKASARQPHRPAEPAVEIADNLPPERYTRTVMSVTEQTTAQLHEKIEPRR
jgi:uncharacterized membrane protein